MLEWFVIFYRHYKKYYFLNDYQLVNMQTLDNSNIIQIDFDKKIIGIYTKEEKA